MQNANRTFKQQAHALVDQLPDNATWYDLQVETASGEVLFDYWYMSEEVGCAGGVTCAVAPLQTMNLPNGDYRWRIQDYGAYGYGVWTAYQTFTLNVSTAVVQLGQPSGTLTSWDHTFHWTGIPAATWYKLDVQTLSGTVLYSEPVSPNSVLLTSCRPSSKSAASVFTPVAATVTTPVSSAGATRQLLRTSRVSAASGGQSGLMSSSIGWPRSSASLPADATITALTTTVP